MKKIVLVTVTALFFTTAAVAQSQTETKKLFLNAELSGLNVNFTPSPFTLDASVGGGYFITNHLALRAQLGLSYVSGTNINFGIGGRYYLGGLFLDALFNGANTGRDNAGKRQLEFGARGALGYAIFLNDHVAFEPAVTLGKRFVKNSDIQAGLNATFSIYF
ncbi:MAG: hypothetical protein LBD87_01600 [Prevotellaceae bacterium]|jgi:hypothetical protein|nr:hypothetical protein [Prevotellaceae bacterium]